MTTYIYDTAGRTKTRTEGDLITRYAYTAGRLVRTTTPGGKTTETVFDLLGRSVGRIDPILTKGG
jgi:YD repeat-containing protein